MVTIMNLTTENILTILKECKGHVKSLKMTARTIEVEFIVPHQPTDKTPLTHNQGQDPILQLDIPEEKNLMKDLTEGKDPEQMEEELKIDELAITDPSAYEDLIAMKEIVDAKEKNT